MRRNRMEKDKCERKKRQKRKDCVRRKQHERLRSKAMKERYGG